MSKVNWEAKSDYEYVQNYKLLQVAFRKHKVERYVDVEKLVKAKYQDNLEFCQWMKAFFDHSGAFQEDYDPVAKRSKGKGAKKVAQLLDKNASKFNSKPLPTQRRSTTTTRPTASARSSATSRTTAAPKPAVRSSARATSGKENKDHLTEAVLADAQLMKKNSDLTNKVTELESTLQECETERDFYFEKLRDVEIMLQVVRS